MVECRLILIMHEGFVANMAIVHLPVRSHRRTRMQLSIIAWCNSFYATDTSSLRTCLPLTNSSILALSTYAWYTWMFLNIYFWYLHFETKIITHL